MSQQATQSKRMVYSLRLFMTATTKQDAMNRVRTFHTTCRATMIRAKMHAFCPWVHRFLWRTQVKWFRSTQTIEPLASKDNQWLESTRGKIRGLVQEAQVYKITMKGLILQNLIRNCNLLALKLPVMLAAAKICNNKEICELGQLTGAIQLRR